MLLQRSRQRKKPRPRGRPRKRLLPLLRKQRKKKLLPLRRAVPWLDSTRLAHPVGCSLGDTQRTPPEL